LGDGNFTLTFADAANASPKPEQQSASS
jgi:hypothetical protein